MFSFTLSSLVARLPTNAGKAMMREIKEPKIPHNLIETLYDNSGLKKPKNVYLELIGADDIHSLDVYCHYFVNINSIHFFVPYELAITQKSVSAFGWLTRICYIENWIEDIRSSLMYCDDELIIDFLMQVDNQDLLNSVLCQSVFDSRFELAAGVIQKTRCVPNDNIICNLVPRYSNPQVRDLIRSIGFIFKRYIPIIFGAMCQYSVLEGIGLFLNYVDRDCEDYISLAITSPKAKYLVKWLISRGFKYNKQKLLETSNKNKGLLEWIEKSL